MGPLPLHSAISHLNQQELDELMAGYLSGEKAVELIRRYKIDAHSNQLRTILPRKLLGQVCSVCGAAMAEEVPKRVGKNLLAGKVSCSACGHEESHSCRCQHCVMERCHQAREERARQQAKLVDAIVKEQINCRTNCSFADTSLTEAIAFLALIRCCPVDVHSSCGPLAESPVPYAPTAALRKELLDLLRQAGLIAVSEQSVDGTIEFDGEKIIYDAQDVRWIVPANGTQELVNEIELAGLTGLWPDRWYDEAKLLWQKLALSECRQFYDYCAKMRGLHARSDGAVNTMLANLLRDFSVGQAYRVIWNGARAASDFLITKKPNRAHAANYMVGASQRWADRARAEGWQVLAFKRNFDLPRCMISYVLFDVIYKIGERGFTEVICQPSGKFD
jgi:hypothetical protein